MNEPTDLVTSTPSAPAVIQAPSVEDGYRMMAQKLLLDEELWSVFERRCERIAAVRLNGYTSANSVMIAALQGLEMGLSLMRSLKLITVIHDRPTIRGPQAVSFVRMRCPGAVLNCVESTEKVARWEMGRPGEKNLHVYTAHMAEVEAAGLKKRNETWVKWPRRLLKWHAASEGCQELFGDVLAGVVLSESVESGEFEEPQNPSFFSGSSKERNELDRDHAEIGAIDELVGEYAALHVELEPPAEAADAPEHYKEVRREVWRDLYRSEVRGTAPTLAEARTMQMTLRDRIGRTRRALESKRNG